MTVTVVIPTVGRRSLHRTLAPLAGRLPVLVVDDRVEPSTLELPPGVRVLASGGRGPAAARNVGWRAASTGWVAFLDDDVAPPARWVRDLMRDLDGCAADVGGSQGRLRVPLPVGRRPTDWERGTAGLERAVWATADMAYRREALAAVGGFDERFPRAYREDADLGLRVLGAGWRIGTGRRTVEHPVRPAPWDASLRQQRGNADDVLMRALRGPAWRDRAQAPPGRLPWHLATTGTALAALLRPGWRRPAGAAWLALTTDFAVRRTLPGPRTPREVATMTATSALIPFAASWWWAAGRLTLGRRLRAAGPCPEPGAAPAARAG